MPKESPVRAPLAVTEDAGERFIEGPPDQPFMLTVDDATLVLEACFSNRTRSAILHASNMTPKFFDLSSAEAGAILQRLRTYGTRVALVCPPGSVQFSARFAEMAAEETRGKHFGVLESVQAAREWLRRSADLK
jgi:Domain of unknown function (DUF4180)